MGSDEINTLGVLSWKMFNIAVVRLMKRRATTEKLSVKSSFVYGGVCLLLGISLYVFLFEAILEHVLQWQIQLKEGTLVFRAWKDLPFPMRIKIFVFQLENGAQFQDGSQSPSVTEIGPFYFNEYRKRDILGWSHNRGVIKFAENLRFTFDESKSVGPLTTKVTVINAPLVLIFGFIDSKLKEFNLSAFRPFVTKLISIVFRLFEERLVEERTIEELLSGRKLGILQIVKVFSKLLRAIGVDVPSSIGFGFYQITESSFGFLHLRQNQTFGPVEMYTGQTADGLFNTFHSFNNQPMLTFFRDECNRIRGNEGTFAPVKQFTSPLYLFNQHLCRPFKFLYVGYVISIGSLDVLEMAPIKRLKMPLFESMR